MQKYAYLAGIIDGEGTIGICRTSRGKYRAPYISVSSTTVELIEWLHQFLGGTVCRHKPYKKQHSHAYSWRLRAKESVFSTLRSILPYLVVPEKIRRANLILREYDMCTVRNGKYTKTQRTIKLDFEKRFLHPSKPSRKRKAPISL